MMMTSVVVRTVLLVGVFGLCLALPSSPPSLTESKLWSNSAALAPNAEGKPAAQAETPASGVGTRESKDGKVVTPPPPAPVVLSTKVNAETKLKEPQTPESMENNAPPSEPQQNQPVADVPSPSVQSGDNSQQQQGKQSTTDAAEPLDLMITIPTMRRWQKDGQPAPEQYLFPLVSTIANAMTDAQKQHTKILLYNVDKEPEKHLEVENLQKTYGNLIEVVVKPQKSAGTGSEQPINSEEKVTLEKTSGEVLQVTHTTMEWIAGETNDATSLLFDARKRAPYVMFLEDDVKPTHNVVSKITDYVHEMKKRGIDDWFMVDLYTPKIDWGRNPLYVQNFERYDYECCTQAMLFRSDKLLDVLLYETLHPNIPVDDNIRDYAREDSANRGIYAILPNLFEHVGRYSSNPEKSSETVEHLSLNFVP